MAKNLTHFLETLPNDLDSWNTTYRQDFYTNSLQGFDWLPNSTQAFIATNLSKEDLENAYDFAVLLMTDPEGAYNATVDFFGALISGNTPSTTTEFPICQNTFALDVYFVYIYLYPLIAVVLLMSFFKTRKNLCLNRLWGRPGVLYPINFIDEYERRWMYTAVFVLLAHRILYLFDGTYYFSPTIPKNFGFLSVFVILVNVIMLCTEFYPMLACIVMRRNVIANILGFILTIPWIFALIVKYGVCPPTKREGVEGKADTDYYNALAEVLYESLLFLALLVILLGFLYDFILNVKRFCESRKKLSAGEKSQPLVDSPEELCMVYINSLMKRKPPPKNMALKEKLRHNLRYARMQGFKYPPRVVCTVLIGLYALYKTATELTFWSWYLSDIGIEIFRGMKVDLVDLFNSTRDYELALIYINTIQRSLIGCLVSSFVIQILLMAHFVSQYRKHIRLFFAGDHSWHHKYTSSPAGILVSGMRYSGYQVAFLIYGFVFVAVVLFVVVMLFAGFIVIPLATKTENSASRFFIDKFIALWPAVLLGFLLYFAQLLLAKYLFLQENGAYVALTNRRLYHVFSYFLFFFNVVLGIFSCLKRILISLILGTLLISRLDRCLLMRGFERFDTGFSSYLGMLTVDVYHNHPIVKGFVHILKEEVKASKKSHSGSREKIDRYGTINKGFSKSDEDGHAPETIQIGTHPAHTPLNAPLNLTEQNELKPLLRQAIPVPGDMLSEQSEQSTYHITAQKRVRNKYWKFVTLLNNPSLVLDRMQKEFVGMKEAASNNALGTVVDGVAGFTSVFLGTGLIGEGMDANGFLDSTRM